jgi:hypothetical protein
MEDTANLDYDEIIQSLDQTKIVHFGAIVYISTKESSDQDHFLFGDGFITKSLHLLQNYEKTTEDLSGCLFKIVPPYSFLLQKEVYKEIDEYKQNKNC